ncbi:hypothetical protein P167DRAFT_508070 [Morchella conica CCBAS932]|uniref:F-box domain-containing protein n=1 Tax=Morchella conica CCBAS932 TaxID=1392247 RepID=A0A3N4KPS4_9PEZI|nr:hypothetical protein P167DRAFT_508070 [Morchella conica CCBAS932]
MDIPKPSKHILDLPNEILTLTLDLLDGVSLGRCLKVSRRFNILARSELIWARVVSPLRLSSPTPYESFRELYAALHHHFWLHGRVWHGDRQFTGCLFIARYNPERGAIQIYNLLAHSMNFDPSSVKPWSLDPTVFISDIQPFVRLWESPIFSLTKDTPPNAQFEIEPPSTWGSIASSLSRTTVVPVDRQVSSMSLWPPTKIPSAERTRNSSEHGYRDGEHQPESVADASQKLFRFRKWMRFDGASGSLADRLPYAMKEKFETFAALDSWLYTPDERHPFRGLWVGDYSVHGWEFILFHQPNPNRLEGIKITGDIHVPRGEYTFIVEELTDISRIAHEVEWPGAKAVKGKGQIAASQFVDNKFVDIEVIFIGPDNIALHWLDENLRHISKMNRLDINEFIYSKAAISFTAQDG